MTRMILNREDRDKSWLERKARQEEVSTAEVVRQTVRRMQYAEEESLDQVLAATRGVWRKGDGLRCQRSVRRE